MNSRSSTKRDYVHREMSDRRERLRHLQVKENALLAEEKNLIAKLIQMAEQAKLARELLDAAPRPQRRQGRAPSHESSIRFGTPRSRPGRSSS